MKKVYKMVCENCGREFYCDRHCHLGSAINECTCDTCQKMSKIDPNHKCEVSIPFVYR